MMHAKRNRAKVSLIFHDFLPRLMRARTGRGVSTGCAGSLDVIAAADTHLEVKWAFDRNYLSLKTGTASSDILQSASISAATDGAAA
jgi:hypothetical protein